MKNNRNLYRVAFYLAMFTILYNVVEGIIATIFGYTDGSLALFGFGLDSFIEVISGLGIAHMTLRIQQFPDSSKDRFERKALYITGFAFYFLFFGLLLTSIYHIYIGHRPDTTLWGVVVAILSIIVMYVLVSWKRKVGYALRSEPILADANCTMVCIYMSLILLVSSGLYELFGLRYIDSVGTLGLAYFCFTEGRECFEKANSEKYCGCD